MLLGWVMQGTYTGFPKNKSRVDFNHVKNSNSSGIGEWQSWQNLRLGVGNPWVTYIINKMPQEVPCASSRVITQPYILVYLFDPIQPVC